MSLDVEIREYLKPDIPIEELEEVGWFKLMRIRNFTIHARHVYKLLFLKQAYKAMIDYFYDKFFSWKDSQLELFNKLMYIAIRRTHKQSRDGRLPILQIFDFDNTITRYKSLDPEDPYSIHRLVGKGLYSMFFNKEDQYSPYLAVDRIIVSARGDIESIRGFLDRHGIGKLFSRIYACGGEKKKSHKLFEIRQKSKYDFILYYDDDLKFAVGSLLFLFIPFWVDKDRIRKIDIDGKNETREYVEQWIRKEIGG